MPERRVRRGRSRRVLVMGIAACAVWVWAGTARGYEKNPLTIFCPIVEEAPAVDGEVDEEEWGDAGSILKLKDQVTKADVEDTVVRVMADSSTLYVAFECYGPDGKPKLVEERARDEASATDDAVMVMLDMNHDNRSSKVFLVSYSGGQRDGANRYPDIGGLGEVSWNAEWESAVWRGEESWSVEMAIPLEQISGAGIEAGRTVGVNFGRSRPGLATRSCLVLGGGGFRPPWYADMVFGPAGVALSEIVMPSWRQGENSVEMKFRNYGTSEAEVEVSAKALFGWGGEDWEAERLSPAAGEEKAVRLSGYAFGDAGNRFEVKVRKGEGGREVYSAVYHFATNDAVDEGSNLWKTKTSGSVCFQPEPFVVRLWRPEGRTAGREFSASTVVRSARGGGEVVRRTASEKVKAPAKGGLAIVTGTEGLADGQYAVYVTLSDAEGKRVLRTAHDFVCVGGEFGGLKESVEELSRDAAIFEQERLGRGIARSSALLLRYYAEEAERQLAGADVETFRKSVAACLSNVEKGKGLAEAFAKKTDPLRNKTGLVRRAFVSPYDGRVRAYTVFVPSKYKPTEAMPLVAHLLADGPISDGVFMAGVQEVWDHTVKGLEEKGFIGVWPSLTRRLEAELNFFAVLEEMKRDYNIDAERVYLMGVSGGGLSSWLIGLRHPDQIAAIAPISGVTVASQAIENAGGDPDTIDKSRSAYYFPMNALHVPVIVLHGDADSTTKVEEQARPMVEKMRELGLEVEYHEYAGAPHGLGKDYMDAFDKIMEFFARHRNVRYPKTIDFSTPSLRYNKAYWIWLEQLTEEGEFARVKAEAKDNVVRIETENVSVVSLVPRPEVLDLEEPVKVVIDGEEVAEVTLPGKRTHSGPWMRFTKNEEGRWR